jgi:hypothetical protein
MYFSVFLMIYNKVFAYLYMFLFHRKRQISGMNYSNFTSQNELKHIWLIDYLRFYVPLKNLSLIWKRHHCRWRAAKSKFMFDACLSAGMDLYCATPVSTHGFGFPSLIRKTAPFTWGCGGFILTRVLTGVKHTWNDQSTVSA